MKLFNIALLSATFLAASVVVVGCKNSDDDASDDSTETLGTSESQLVEDDTEASDTDADLEAGIDEPLSGGSETDPGDPADGASDDEVVEKVRKNAGVFFKPAGCLVSTRDGNKVAHVFTGCTGPQGLAKFEGTVTSTYVREAGKLTITHEATGFTANGATVSGKRIIEYTRAAGVITKRRTGDWTGTTAKGKEMTHTANFVTAYSIADKCITRDGSAQTTIGGRSFERVVAGYKRCGIGHRGCPEQGGKITLSKTKSAETLTVTLEFLGGVKLRVTRPSGKQVTRVLACNPR